MWSMEDTQGTEVTDLCGAGVENGSSLKSPSQEGSKGIVVWQGE